MFSRRNLVCVLMVLCSSVVTVVLGQALLDLSEGETCKREGNATWTCTKLTECKDIGDFKQTRPPICSFEGKEPIVCCPGKRKPSGQALVRCLKYEFSACLERLLPQPQNTKPKQHPYMALIGFGPVNGKEWLCGGTLISERFVLSTASCTTTNRLGAAKWIKLGDYSPSQTSGNADHIIEGTAVHPEYKPGQLYHDLALFRLKSEVRFDASVKPACLNTEAENTSETAMTTEFVRPEVGPGSNSVRDINMSVMEGEKCKVLIGNETSKRLPKGLDAESQICATDPLSPKTSCIVNKGSPLVISKPSSCLKTLMGVSLLGRQCAAAGSPGVYARILEYIPWIESIVWP